MPKPSIILRIGLLVGAALAGAAQAQDKAAPAQKAAAATATGGAPNVAMCIGCHGIQGYKTAFPEVYHVPLIAGQQPAYIVAALKAYRAGQRSHPSMRGVAATLSDEDMEALAKYYGGAK